MVTIAKQVDIYSHERAGLMERLCVLAGQSTYREPMGSFTSPQGGVPHAHALAAGLSYAQRRLPEVQDMRRVVMRRDPTDIGPDVVECLVYRRVVNGLRIRAQLVRALRDMSGKLARAKENHVRACCLPIIRECATGMEEPRPAEVPPGVWIPASALGIRLLWASAGETLRALAEKLR